MISEPRSRRPRRKLVLLLFTASLWLLPRPARAFHTEEQRTTDDTADTLESSMWRVGLFKAEYTPFKSSLVGTYPLPWFLRVPNLHLKWRYYQGAHLSLSARLGYFGFDTKRLDKLEEQKTHAQLRVVPFDLAGTWRFGKKTSLSLDVIWTSVAIDGQADEESFNGTLQGGTTNLQNLLTFEWRLTRVTALLLQSRWLTFQIATLKSNVVLHPDEFTTVEIYGDQQTDALNFRGASSLTLSALFSWKHLNLRLGIGYGNYNVPGLNFMMPNKMLFPDLDVYWVF